MDGYACWLEPSKGREAQMQPARPPWWTSFSRKEYSGLIMAAPKAGVTIRAVLPVKGLTSPPRALRYKWTADEHQ